jgi:hypothetical protein
MRYGIVRRSGRWAGWFESKEHAEANLGAGDTLVEEGEHELV